MEYTENAKNIIEHWNETVKNSGVIQAFCNNYYIPSEEIAAPDNVLQECSRETAFIIFRPNDADNPRWNGCGGEICFDAYIHFDISHTHADMMGFGNNGEDDKQVEFYLTTICGADWRDYYSILPEKVVYETDTDFVMYVEWLKEDNIDLTGTLTIGVDNGWRKTFEVSHNQAIEATSLTQLVSDCLETERQKSETSVSGIRNEKSKSKLNQIERD